MARAQATILRLENGGFLMRDEAGKLSRSDLLVRFPTDRSHTSIRRYQRAMLEKAREELLKPNPEERFDLRLITSVNFAGSSAKLKEAKAMLNETLYRVADLMLSEPECDEVYQLNIQIFPVTR